MILEQFDSFNSLADMDPLYKVILVVGAAMAAVISLLILVCMLADGCLLHDILASSSKFTNNCFPIFTYLREKGEKIGAVSGFVRIYC